MENQDPTLPRKPEPTPSNSPSPATPAVGAPAPSGPASGPKSNAAPTAPPMIQYDDFAKLDLRIATVLECKPHSNADKLLVLQVDLGGEKRQICAGLRQYYAPEELVGKQIIIVANLAPRTMRGEVSQGMLLAATDSAAGKVIFVTPSIPAAAGSKVS